MLIHIHNMVSGESRDYSCLVTDLDELVLQVAKFCELDLQQKMPTLEALVTALQAAGGFRLSFSFA